MIKAGSPEDMGRMMVRLDTDKVRPMDDSSPIRDLPKYGRPLVCVNGIYGKAAAWSHSYGLMEWLDVSGTYHLGWAQSASIKRVSVEDWKGSSGL
ncbi:hypothetical protein [Arthrobacter oryzae]|uniref:hypothetical protein n=1 Tax=Arthrobacter oryzae TaxID=409290 RepID=UPI00273CD89E|nr:hypothetical protein [Arthrobacter oryzae]WLQ05059.1 hypothetical protein Q8Z05_12970 [Arthrobacter oryzae]